MLSLLGLNVSSIANDQIFEGMSRIILRQPTISWVSGAPAAFKQRLKFSGFALRMPTDDVAKLGLAVGNTVDLNAEYVLGTTLGSNNNAPLIEVAGTEVSLAKESEGSSEPLPW
jgi:hypothetical protein